MDNPIWPIIWTACGVVTIVAAFLATRSQTARYVGRGAVAVLFVLGGALVHVINLATGNDYSGFADPAHFAWVTNAWEAVVPSRVFFFIGLLAVFEATVGILALCGGRWTQLSYAAVIAFYSALWLFGWIEAVWCLVMIPPMILLLRAERRAASAAAVTAPVEPMQPPADVPKPADVHEAAA